MWLGPGWYQVSHINSLSASAEQLPDEVPEWIPSVCALDNALSRAELQEGSLGTYEIYLGNDPQPRERF
jgi:hypothetical protein